MVERNPYQARMERERRTIHLMAADALKRLRKVDTTRAPDKHIYDALDAQGIQDMSDRRRLIPLIRTEMKRIQKKQEEQRQVAEVQKQQDAADRAEAEAMLRREATQQQIKDAYRHAWNNQVESDTGYDPKMPDHYNSEEREED